MIGVSRRAVRNVSESHRELPEFVPHPCLRGAHAQTIGGRYLWNGRKRLAAVRHELALDDGDRLCVLETTPRDWSVGMPAAVLVHGLAGCANAPYVVRVSRRLVAMGVRVVRMNLRGAGQGFGLSRGVYHAGCSDDLRAVVSWLVRQAPGSPVALLGFSLGGNVVLKLAAEAADRPVPGLDCVVAANPPIDLSVCSEAIQRPNNRIYDWNFVTWLRREVLRLHREFPDLGQPNLDGVRSIYEFDDRYTAPRNGFDSADDYYRRCSSAPRLSRITAPGLVVHSKDDPFIPVEPFLHASFPPRLQLELIRHGGHLGYVSRSRWLGDRRWLDARLTTWLSARWQDLLIDSDSAPSSATRGGNNLGASRCHA